MVEANCQWHACGGVRLHAVVASVRGARLPRRLAWCASSRCVLQALPEARLHSVVAQSAQALSPRHPAHFASGHCVRQALSEVLVCMWWGHGNAWLLSLSRLFQRLSSACGGYAGGRGCSHLGTLHTCWIQTWPSKGRSWPIFECSWIFPKRS